MAKPTPKAKARVITFETSLKTFVRSTKASMIAALACATLSIRHFAEHGDLSQCQKFLDAMEQTGKNYVRRGAFLKWLVYHAPVKMEGGKLLKDKARAEKEGDTVRNEDGTFVIGAAYQLDKAEAKSFWDFAPDPEETLFTSPDVYKAFMSIVNRLRKETVKLDPAAKVFVDNVESFVKQQKAVVARIKATEASAEAQAA